jgi:2-(1,2-epoxy-1,2-dihydrophenyl)acetyl-CoA isomerase
MNHVDPISYSVADRVAHIELNRPDAFNALNIPLARGLADAAGRATANDDVAVVLLTGRGRAFCAGGDVKMMASSDRVSEAVLELAAAAHEAVIALAQLSKPVIAAVHGSVAGGGVGLTCSADVVLAAESTKFIAAYPGIAVTPDCSLTWALPRIVGERRALEFMLLNEPVSARTAQQWGLVTSVHPDESVMSAGADLAHRLARGSAAAALGATRALVRGSAERTLAEQLSLEAASISAFVAAPAAGELLSSFAKR